MAEEKAVPCIYHWNDISISHVHFRRFSSDVNWRDLKSEYVLYAQVKCGFVESRTLILSYIFLIPMYSSNIIRTVLIC